MSAPNILDDRSGPRVGDPAPIFVLTDPDDIKWSPLEFNIAGKPVVIIFETAGAEAAAQVLTDILSPTGPLAGKPLTVFHIGPRPPSDIPPPEFPGFSYHRLYDADGDIYRAYGFAPGGAPPLAAVVLDPNCRIAGITGSRPGESPGREIAACIEKITNERAGGPASAHAPVLIIPRLLDETECQRCIDLWQQYDTAHQGVGHSEINEGGKTFLREYGAMKQYLVEAPEPQAWLDSIIAPRVTEEISKAFGTRATNREFYGLLCYDSKTKGHVLPHRDCATPETEHRRFTVSVMLNSDYQGGELRFQEYSNELYRMPRGCAVVYSSALLHEVMPVIAGVRYAIAFHLYGT